MDKSQRLQVSLWKVLWCACESGSVRNRGQRQKEVEWRVVARTFFEKGS